MSERIKNMTVQQLIDAGFKVQLTKYNCGGDPVLNAKQWMDAPVTGSFGGSVWATNYRESCSSNPEITFYR